MAETCKECGCKCVRCTQNDQQHDMHLHVEIENLRQCLMERDNHIVTMETQFLNEADKFPNGELASIKEELTIWQEKYSRLYEAHKRVQKVNQNLEDKLLRIVDKCETEKSAFTKDIATLSHRLADANYTIHRLTQDNEKYRNDVNLAIQLLQCKPSNFVGQKYDSLPSEVQAKVRTYVAQKLRSNDVNPPDVKSITVPISTFPPTAMVYNVTKPTADKFSDDDSDESKPPVDIVSAAIMAKVLEDREKERIFAKHCNTCSCNRSILMVDAETQTNLQDVFSCNECTTKCTHNEKHTDSFKIIDKNSQAKENQHTITYYEVNENSINNSKIQYQNNGNCAKNMNYQQLPTRDKFVTRNDKNLEHVKDDTRVNVNGKVITNKKNSMRRSDAQMQNVFQNQNENLNKQTTSQITNDACINGKVNSEKSKQGRVNTRCDMQTDVKTNGNYWNKSEKKSSYGHTLIDNSKTNQSGREQSHIDIINDRLWKNEWTKMKSQVNLRDSRNADKVNSEIEIDVINDRDWKNDRSGNDTRHPAKLTLIEVKNMDNITIQNDSEKMDVATSPSFSSDSMMISTSDPSSSSSDVLHPVLGTQLTQNINNNIKSMSQNRISGPRNCLVRVTPGSKNILLDNAGHYKTVLYTSKNNKPNTALVHTKKSSRSGSERSMSTSGEENSPVLLHDNNQLQRVAEWVQSSVCMDNNVTDGYNKVKPRENIMDKSPSLLYLNETQPKYKTVDRVVSSNENTQGKKRDDAVINIDDFVDESFNNGMKNVSSSSNVNCTQDENEKEKDLITFDVPNEEEKAHKNSSKENSSDFQYEVKITKEMEETYLKLAASLDPVTFSLSSTDSADLTIEKYRKDHKRLHVQRNHDKAGSKT